MTELKPCPFCGEKDDIDYGITLEEDLYRIYKLRDMGYYPYVMVYDKPNADEVYKRLQRWCNNRWRFKSCAKFEDYRR